VGRKLGQRGGANLQAFLKDVQTFVASLKEHPTTRTRRRTWRRRPRPS
jgi:hypothetical protein